jgi:hypothetical protein
MVSAEGNSFNHLRFPSDTFQFNGCLGEHPKVVVSINRHPGQDVRQE